MGSAMSARMTLAVHGTVPKEWIASEVRARADTLEEYCGDIVSWRVAVDLPHRHHRDGNRVTVRIELMVHGKALTVTHGLEVHGLKQDLDEQQWVKQLDAEGMRKRLRLVIKEVFDVVRGRLQDYASLRRHAVKTHEKRMRGAA
jgi:hypothetical protein